MDTRITRVMDLGPQGPQSEEACLVQIYGPNLGKKYSLGPGGLTTGPGAAKAEGTSEVTIGRGDQNTIVLELDNVSRRHCSLLSREDGVWLRDDGSTNGTYLNNIEVRAETMLRSGDLIKIGSAIFKFLYGGELGSIEAQYHEEIYRLTIIDGLTQVYNKRYLIEFIDREMARCGRHGRSLSIVMIDVDHFKNINDTYGHLAGDYVLRELAAQIKTRIRREECFARYGGEEFVLVLPETGHENTVFLAEKLRKMIEGHRFVFEGKEIKVTFSGGVADMTPEQDGPLAFLNAADAKLYEAKRSGRNRIAGMGGAVGSTA
jgi:diguanylate cyclase (GGDEF)-like protein